MPVQSERVGGAPDQSARHALEEHRLQTLVHLRTRLQIDAVLQVRDSVVHCVYPLPAISAYLQPSRAPVQGSGDLGWGGVEVAVERPGYAAPGYPTAQEE